MSERIAIISGSMLAAGLLLRELTIKRIHTGKHTTLRAIEHNYENLNSK